MSAETFRTRLLILILVFGVLFLVLLSLLVWCSCRHDENDDNGGATTLRCGDPVPDGYATADIDELCADYAAQGRAGEIEIHLCHGRPSWVPEFSKPTLLGIVGPDVATILGGEDFAALLEGVEVSFDPGGRLAIIDLASAPSGLDLRGRVTALIEGQEELSTAPIFLRSFHPGSRAHPVDDLEIGGAGHTPAPLSDQQDSARKVLVVDAAGTIGEFVGSRSRIEGHGEFIRAEILAMAPDADVAPLIPVTLDLVSLDGKRAYIHDGELIASMGVAGQNAGGPAAMNVSLGAPACDDGVPAALTEKVDELVEKDIAIVASAGNNESDQPVYPAAFATDHDLVWSVGSLTQPGVRSCFSNFGSWVSNWENGEEVVVEVPGPGSMTASWSGSSFAAPQVTALLAYGTMHPKFADPPPDVAPPAKKTAVDGIDTWCNAADEVEYQPEKSS